MLRKAPTHNCPYLLLLLVSSIGASIQSASGDLVNLQGTITDVTYVNGMTCSSLAPLTLKLGDSVALSASFSIARPVDQGYVVFGIEAFTVGNELSTALDNLAGQISEESTHSNVYMSLSDGRTTAGVTFFDASIDTSIFPTITSWTTALWGVNLESREGLDCMFIASFNQGLFFPGGDANFDHRFDTGDLVSVFQAGEYEDGIADNSRWADGDWNADRDFDTNDLVLVFQEGRYEAPALAASVTGKAIVPEPTSGVLGSCVAMFMIASSRVFRRHAN